jgi:minor histocompatibility antigen H13
MVTVAKSFDAPVKLLFPKEIFAQELHFSMLGLGDIVIPGKITQTSPLTS